MTPSLSIPLLLTILLMPLCAAAIVGIGATAAGGNRLSQRMAHRITIVAVGITFALSAWVLWQTIQGARFNQTVYEWMRIGNLRMEIGFMIDGMTALMMCVVTFVSFMVHIYSTGYMHGDAGYSRFFAYISLFTFAMLLLVMGNNLLQLFIGWEGVGVASYLLIGFWFDRPPAIFANKKAFVVNRVADLGFILGIGLVVAHTGTLNYQEIFTHLDALTSSTLPGTTWAVITVACILLFVGAMGKSAQFPLHVWLPDSMHGPTPSSALIHAATMVTAGIFMVSRLSPLFELSDIALNFILTIGAASAFLMGLMGLIQYDIKRVVAYSTLSQLGYMVMGLGASAYSVSVFHLFTHAFFKALLFLAAGSVIMGMHHNQDMRYMGGLRKYMPITHWTSLAGTLALIGMPLFSGFYSKDGIIEALHFSQQPMAKVAYWSALCSVFVTAFYSMRVYFVVFWGNERYDQNPDAHHDDHHGEANEHGDDKPHESPWVVTVPLILLAIPSICIGLLTMDALLFGDFLADAIHINHTKHTALKDFQDIFTGVFGMAAHGLVTPPFWFMAAGIVSAAVLYLGKNNWAEKIRNKLAPFVHVLDQKYYLDWFYDIFIGHGVLRIGRVLWQYLDMVWMWIIDQGSTRFLRGIGGSIQKIGERFLLWLVDSVLAGGARVLGQKLYSHGDQGIIEAKFVNASWKTIAAAAARIRRVQTGYLYHYALVMILGLLVLMTWFVWVQ